MTANQLAYQRLREEVRHNVAYETETHRSNVAHEAIEWARLHTQQKQNKAQVQYWSDIVGIDRDKLRLTDEVERRKASLESLKLQESVRNNMFNNELNQRTVAHQIDIDWSKFGLEQKKVAEQIRTNLINEELRSTEAAVKAQDVAVRSGQLALAQRQQDHYESTFVDSSSKAFKAFERNVGTVLDGSYQAPEFTTRISAADIARNKASIDVARVNSRAGVANAANNWAQTIGTLGAFLLGTL